MTTGAGSTPWPVYRWAWSFKSTPRTEETSFVVNKNAKKKTYSIRPLYKDDTQPTLESQQQKLLKRQTDFYHFETPNWFGHFKLGIFLPPQKNMARERNNKETLPKMCDAKIPHHNMFIHYIAHRISWDSYLPYTPIFIPSKKRTLPNDHLTCRVTISTGAGFLSINRR